MRLAFLLEASLTAGGFSLLALVLIHRISIQANTWSFTGGVWAIFMCFSLYRSHASIKLNRIAHGDIDKFANIIGCTCG
ncbi:MAG: hypothetical protein KUG75_02585 [Pseudomonadales bacterium]|nr:hypothetical protein [Pseudomonadales bacterium]